MATGTLTVWALVLSGVSVVVSVLVTAVVLVRLPADAFAESRRRWPPSLLHRVLRIGMNALGWVLILLGLILSLPGVPGQGILTILLGLLCVDFPGRGRLLRRILSRPAIRRGMDRLRVRFGRAPFTW